MATINSTGIGSGLDIATLIPQLMAVESRPLTLLKSAKSELDTQVSAFGKLQSLTSAMRDAAAAVASVSLWGQTSASSSDSTSVAVTTTNAAAVGNYSVSVRNLAAGQTVSSHAFATSTTALSTGKLTIELGSYASEPAPDGFTAKAGATPVSIEIGDGETSLSAIRDKINAAAAGVTASIVNDASGARLALRSSTTGAENAFRISVDGGGDAATGLAALAYDATASADAPSPMLRNQSALNANATINGIDVTSASNTLANVADGMTLTLLKATGGGGSVDVGVAADGTAVKDAVTSFVSAFNALASNIRDQTKYDPTSKTGGTLQGDRVVGSLLSQLRGVINQPSSASATYRQLSDIGIVMQTDGTLTVAGSKLDGAIANRGELRKVLAADAANSGASGFMDRFRDLGNALLDTQGSLSTRNSSLQAQITRNQSSQDAMQTRLDQTEARIRKQYQTLDTTMTKLNGLSNYLTGQLAALAKNA